MTHRHRWVDHFHLTSDQKPSLPCPGFSPGSSLAARPRWRLPLHGGCVREAWARVWGVKAVTVELEVRDWRESRATGENLALIFTLRREDVGAQVPAIVLREREG